METHNGYEPMDIDTSGHSVKEMDISYNDSFDVKTFCVKTEKLDVSIEDIQLVSNSKKTDSVQSPVKKYHINIQKPTKSYKNTILQTFCAGIVIIMSIFTFHINSLKCCDDINVEDLRLSLSSKVFGQTQAVQVIIETLKLKERSKLLLFSGGTGVGKTFASSIILDTAGPCTNVYHYTMPSFTNTFSTDFMYGLTMCKTSLIIVDDLTANDFHIKKQIMEVTDKSRHLGKDITVILIYNCYESTKEFKKNCNGSFHNRLIKNFAEIEAVKRFVEFKPLLETHLKECIKQELGNRRLDHKEFDNILKNFNVTIDGCKGVHSKMKYLNIL